MRCTLVSLDRERTWQLNRIPQGAGRPRPGKAQCVFPNHHGSLETAAAFVHSKSMDGSRCWDAWEVADWMRIPGTQAQQAPHSVPPGAADVAVNSYRRGVECPLRPPERSNPRTHPRTRSRAALSTDAFRAVRIPSARKNISRRASLCSLRPARRTRGQPRSRARPRGECP